MLRQLAATGIVIVLLSGCTQAPQVKTNAPNTVAAPQAITFGTPVKSAHFEDSTPRHGQILADAPIAIVINFNFDLSEPSSIKVLDQSGQEYQAGKLTIDQNKLALRQSLQPDLPDGKYQVEYTACWPDQTCHDGQFEFAIDLSLQSSFEDMTGRTAVAIDLADIKFAPQKVKISRGTTVTWTNADQVSHYINTESHPYHTYFVDQNSRALENGDTFSTTFAEPGIYPYHCSAHADVMTGEILVV